MGVKVYSLLFLLICYMLTMVLAESVEEPFFKYLKGDVHYCPIKAGQLVLEALPGGGWDNLQNLDMGLVLAVNYTKCRTTGDGQFLIPDGAYVIPKKENKLDSFAELIEHWSNYGSETSGSMNANLHASYWGISLSGSFSAAYETTKRSQIMDKTKTTRVQIRYHAYKVSFHSAKLDPDFQSRIMDIAAQLQKNNTDEATYLSQLLVKHYGTHFINSIDVGAVLSQTDQVQDTFTSQNSDKKAAIKASASADFFGKVGFSAGFTKGYDQSVAEGYMKHRTDSRVRSFGGPAFKVNFTLTDWQEGLYNNLVAIDRVGDPLYMAITTPMLPGLPQPMVERIANSVQNAIYIYNHRNTHRGCTNPDSNNFDMAANVEDNSCYVSQTNFTFGGVFQMCQQRGGDSCYDLDQKNPLTDDYSCPNDYEAIHLLTGTSSMSKYKCYEKCTVWWWFFYKDCVNQCGNRYDSNGAIYYTYWCVAVNGKAPSSVGLLFGGLFSSESVNPVTRAKSCPQRFLPLKMGTNMKVCVSHDYELGYRSSLPFAGFFSCSQGNPLAKQKSSLTALSSDIFNAYLTRLGDSAWPKHCPPGYRQHLAAFDDSCEVNYCIKANALDNSAPPGIHLPPFLKQFGMDASDVDTKVIIGSAGTVWVYEKTEWIQLQPSDPKAAKALKDIGYVGTPSGSNTAGISVGIVVGILIILVSTGALCWWRRHTKAKRGYKFQEDTTTPVVVVSDTDPLVSSSGNNEQQANYNSV